MLTVLGCFIGEHDLWLVGLAALICSLASAACIALLHHARRLTGGWQAAWLGVAAVAGGSGIWATHFIAMLAFEPSLPTGYAVGLTVLSLAYAIVITGVGLAVALWRALGLAPVLGGVILGGGIAAMHYTGMAAFEVPGHIRWDPGLVAASLILGGVFGGAGLKVGLAREGLRWRIAGALLILLAICGHHFTAMGAVTILPDPGVAIADSALPARWLGVGVALASVAILLMAVAALLLDLRERRQGALARERLHSLANAAVEGLLVCRGTTIVNGNDSFGALVGLPAGDLGGVCLSRFLPVTATPLALAGPPDQPIEASLVGAAGEAIPVELIVRPVTYGDQPHYAVAVRDLRARRQAEGQIQFLAHHDALTGLANRASFTLRLEREMKLAAATGRKLAVLCLDLDRFKEVNDLFGHAAGDALLVTVARTVTELLDDDQLMARLGGDEFAILMPCDHAVSAGKLAEEVLEALRGQNSDMAGPTIAASLGIAVYPDNADERALLLSSADTALYRAKAEGRGTYRFFESTMGAQVRDRRHLEHDLRGAVARGEMHLVYQPQADVATGAVVGFEVLLRWSHPTRGAVSPAAFIPIAEESGVILPLGEWVLREACREAARWTNPLSVAVNVSGVQIHAPNLVPLVQEVLRETGLRPERLEIEVTETALIREPARAQATLRQLKALGVRIAMDDFGTGYSSLSNLRAYPFDKIKIDSSFIRKVDSNAQTAAIVRSVLGLGRGLGMSVLAEGVETAEELGFLVGEDCAAAQGYFLGRPSEIAAFVRHTHPDPEAAARHDLAA
ncbi:bifunctional diguanylate cyclase/phosphodiesterase [Methylobacterium sp. J-076]|uniref:sensor domain-containing diguanylate cyclase n=1 Tax=Methylobacterium sp. J-076 TaxID=2836655 RepID=UPI001FB9C399|nr:bifunctional diguanylate cyclase/phosphodiesterase [Methylobacterium sp. J-076]MCJ2013557.1 EAL domain-containing protein [Methylobacterium sp. J-076]